MLAFSEEEFKELKELNKKKDRPDCANCTKRYEDEQGYLYCSDTDTKVGRNEKECIGEYMPKKRR